METAFLLKVLFCQQNRVLPHITFAPVKKVATLVLSLCLLLQCMASYLVRGLFELNKEYIAANLCENKDKPELDCCGKCVLKKELKKVASENAPSQKSPSKVAKYEVVSLLPAVFVFATARPQTGSAPAVQNPRLQHLYNGGLPTAIFRPPTRAV